MLDRPSLFHGFDGLPDNDEITIAEHVLGGVKQSQHLLKDIYNKLVANCGDSLDYNLHNIITSSDANVDLIQVSFQDFLKGDFSAADLFDMAEKHIAENDKLMATMRSYDCKGGIFNLFLIGGIAAAAIILSRKR